MAEIIFIRTDGSQDIGTAFGRYESGYAVIFDKESYKFVSIADTVFVGDMPEDVEHEIMLVVDGLGAPVYTGKVLYKFKHSNRALVERDLVIGSSPSDIVDVIKTDRIISMRTGSPDLFDGQQNISTSGAQVFTNFFGPMDRRFGAVVNCNGTDLPQIGSSHFATVQHQGSGANAGSVLPPTQNPISTLTQNFGPTKKMQDSLPIPVII